MNHKRPNIILILTDQHRLSALGCYGETVCRTPTIDRLAQNGFRFDTAYTTCPVCSPARASIMTGLYPHAHGICTNIHEAGCFVNEIPDSPLLLSRQLQTAGYQCGYTGKWHLGTKSLTTRFNTPNHPSLPRDVGFTGQNFPNHGNGGFNYPEYKEYLQTHEYSHSVYKAREGFQKTRAYGILNGPIESTVPCFLTDHSIALINQFADSEQPFFLWHNFWGPHSPYYVPRVFYEMYADVQIPEWPNYEWDSISPHMPYYLTRHPDAANLEWKDWAECIRHYYAFTSFIDHQIGRLLNHLEKRNLTEDTVIIFSSDHGETLGSHGGLTDKGWNHFEETQRIPMIASIPHTHQKNESSQGLVIEETVSLADLYPSILNLAGIDVDPEVIHGRSFLPLINGDDVKWRDSTIVEFFGLNNLTTNMLTIRQGNLKYGWNCSNRDELYDLDKDPYEMTNLIADNSYEDSLATLRASLAAWMDETDFKGLGIFKRSRLNEDIEF